MTGASPARGRVGRPPPCQADGGDRQVLPQPPDAGEINGFAALPHHLLQVSALAQIYYQLHFGAGLASDFATAASASGAMTA